MFLESGLLKLGPNILRVVIKNNHKYNQDYGKPKKEFLHWCISKILFIDIEKLSKMQISLVMFFKDFVDRFVTTYLKNSFL